MNITKRKTGRKAEATDKRYGKKRNVPGKKEGHKRKTGIRVIWIFNLLGIGLIITAAVCSRLEVNESGITYAELYFDEEIAPYRDVIPVNLLGLMKRNPEAKEFVLHYPDYMAGRFDEELSLEKNASAEKERKVPLFLQWDEKWGYEIYGNDYLALTGCGPTCLSMVRSGLSGEDFWNPYEVAKMSEEEGYYVKGVGSSWELMKEGAAQLGLINEALLFDGRHIREALENGYLIICAMWPGDFTTTGHFIVLAGVDETGNIIVNDPNSIIRSEKKWALSDLLPQIKNIWCYSYEKQHD